MKITLLIIKEYWYIIVITLLLIVLYFLYSAYSTAKATAERQSNNFAQTQTTPNQRIEVISMQEFKQFKADLLDSIQKKIDKGIKAKNIKNITHLNEYYIDSSTTVYTMQPTPNKPEQYEISYTDSCWGFTGTINCIDTSVTLTKKWFNNNFDVVVYWQRQRWFNSKSKFMPKLFGKKQTFIETINSCNAKTKVVRTNVIKKEQK